MAEEFQESDVVFSDHHSRRRRRRHQYSIYAPSPLPISKKSQNQKQPKSSSPMSIPEAGIRCLDEIEYDDEVGFIGGERLPPHLIVARRISNLSTEMACCSFYVEDENGRILKGRNLCQVRNSILRLTGFIET